MPYKIEPIRISETCYILDGTTPNLPIMHCIDWVGIVFATVRYKTVLLYSWRFSRYSAPIHWLVHCRMTTNNETVSRQMPWAGNIAKPMRSNGKQFTVTREMLTTVARHLSIRRLFVFHRLDPFALLYNKSLNDWSRVEQWTLFLSNLNVSLYFVTGNIGILGKQNSLFPSGPVIKCLI